MFGLPVIEAKGAAINNRTDGAERNPPDGKHHDPEAIVNVPVTQTARISLSTSPPVLDALCGQRLGVFEIECVLGTGGMGRVYSARVTGKALGVEVGSRVALKIVHPHLLETAGFFKRFLREADIGRAVQHPNVVRTFDCDQLIVDGRTNCGLPSRR